MSPGQVLHIFDDENVSLLESESPLTDLDFDDDSGEKVLIVTLEIILISKSWAVRALASYQLQIETLDEIFFLFTAMLA